VQGTLLFSAKYSRAAIALQDLFCCPRPADIQREEPYKTCFARAQLTSKEKLPRATQRQNNVIFLGSTHLTMSDSNINLVKETKVFWSDGFLTGFIGRDSNSVWCNSVW